MELPRFNPHTHEGCDTVKSRTRKKKKVSIHTPTKGVTLFPTSVGRLGYSFNPHTHEGCDRRSLPSPRGTSCFNPHTHEGCDFNQIIVWIMTKSFNPHTHEGCDTLCHYTQASVSSFNPHTHEGCDLRRRSGWNPIYMFQSTHPRRVWRVGFWHFSPALQVSIHTPTKGVTFLFPKFNQLN